jgi:hypothetical protein
MVVVPPGVSTACRRRCGKRQGQDKASSWIFKSEGTWRQKTEHDRSTVADFTAGPARRVRKTKKEGPALPYLINSAIQSSQFDQPLTTKEP